MTAFITIWLTLFIPCLAIFFWASRRSKQDKQKKTADKPKTINITLLYQKTTGQDQ